MDFEVDGKHGELVVIALTAKIPLGETDMTNTAILTVLYARCSIYSCPCMCLLAWILKSLSCVYVLYVYVHVGMCMLACWCMCTHVWVHAAARDWCYGSSSISPHLVCWGFFTEPGAHLFGYADWPGTRTHLSPPPRTMRDGHHLAWLCMWVLGPQSPVLMRASQAL